uniref:Uncharacterized protein n=1 Tax=Arundo donax TaxID=35708 RepID=A0A0A8ZD47_ARUDO
MARRTKEIDKDTRQVERQR